MAGLILIALVRVVLFFSGAGYLPPPFFYNADDTFMDWYNTAYWAHVSGAYDQWLSIYPPLSFVFLRIFSIPACYRASSAVARSCDPVGIWVLLICFALNLVLVFLCFRAADRATAVPRTVAMGLGMPMLFALERGNLIVPCFTLVVLGHGRLIRSAWMKWVAVALTINFKPYLILLAAGPSVRLRWRWLEGCGLICVLIYIVTYALQGDGLPDVLARNTILFNIRTTAIVFNSALFSTSYVSVLEAFKSALPITTFIGSQPVEIAEIVMPMAIRAGQAGVVLCFLLAVFRPTRISTSRMAALGMAAFLATTNPGGYAEVFLLFFVLFEPWRGAFRITALMATYLLCIPFDLPIVKIAHDVEDSFLSSRTVGNDISVNFGQFIRPGLVLLIDYGLVGASLIDLLGRRGAAALSVPDPPPPRPILAPGE
jgi:hypothetical protein